MTTYREAIYMCLDLLKGMSDDFTYTEDHVAYLLDKFRALLLKQRYGNDPKKLIPYSNYQTLEILLSSNDSKLYISDYDIPNLLQLGITRLSIDNYYAIYTDFVSRERFPFVGNNRFISKIWYATIDDNNKLLLKKPNDGTVIEPSVTIKITALFENPYLIASNSTFSLGNDALDIPIPIEESLVTTLIELVVKELAGSVYRPNDEANDNRDDNADMANFIRQNTKSNLAKQLQ